LSKKKVNKATPAQTFNEYVISLKNILKDTENAYNYADHLSGLELLISKILSSVKPIELNKQGNEILKTTLNDLYKLREEFARRI
jgi:hypothetical protein